MKIVVTGALGHIGSAFIREVAEYFPECELKLMDNLSSQRYCSLFDLPKLKKCNFYEEDIMSCDLVSFFKGADVVVHLAAITNAAGSFEIQEQVEEVNFVGTQKVAKACIRVGARLINLSTTSVYGTQEEEVDENCSSEELAPQSPYAKSKFSAENFLVKEAAESGLRFVTCRFGTIYGTSIGMRFHTAINKFCWQAVMNKPITVWSTALHQRRPYLDLKDAIRALCFIIKEDLFDGEVYNVLTTNCTVKEILDIISTRRKNINIEFVDTKIMNQLSYYVLNQKFCNKGFEFQGSLEIALKETIGLLENAFTGNNE